MTSAQGLRNESVFNRRAQPTPLPAPDDSPLILRDVGSQEIYALDLQLP